MSARDRVLGVIAAELNTPVADLSDATTFNDVKADSLDMIEVVMALEEVFDIEITDDEWAAVKNLGEIIALVDTKMGVSA